MDDRALKSKALKRSTILGFAVFAVFAVLLFRILIIQLQYI